LAAGWETFVRTKSTATKSAGIPSEDLTVAIWAKTAAAGSATLVSEERTMKAETRSGLAEGCLEAAMDEPMPSGPINGAGLRRTVHDCHEVPVGRRRPEV
jgi:hypothetical protein